MSLSLRQSKKKITDISILYYSLLSHYSYICLIFLTNDVKEMLYQLGWHSVKSKRRNFSCVLNLLLWFTLSLSQGLVMLYWSSGTH